jgi:hypothetical protein
MKIAIDMARFAAAGLAFTQEGAFGVFTLPAPENLAQGESPPAVRVSIAAGSIALFPERSSAQKKLLVLLA